MKIVFLGTGEAFDENVPNNSHLVIAEKTNMLLDCGFTAPPQVWKFNQDKNFLDAIYISHQHADHYFGLPALFVRMWEEGRIKPITIICQKSFIDSFYDLMDFAYKGFKDKFKFSFNFIESEKDKNCELEGLKLCFEETVHSENNLAVKISDKKNSVCYSGDGSPKKDSKFYNYADLLIQETYLYDEEKIGHSSIVSAIDFSEKNNIKCLAITHINRNLRKNELWKIKDTIKSDKVEILIPEPFDEYSL
ncbi:MAG: ribonuclease Z [Candidatus Staskawiczbacteria bacterium]|nr:ribonuclease Z [Candidatus Staskawiczbacteria bacterium]